jgi:hypothetical protein
VSEDVPPLVADPDIIGCKCGKTDCRHQRRWKVRLRREYDVLTVLKPDDVAWLRAHGWDERIPGG